MPSTTTARRRTPSQVQIRQPQSNPPPGPSLSNDYPASMVQQLADVAQTARELLGMEVEDGELSESDEVGIGGLNSNKLDPLGQILLLRFVWLKLFNWTNKNLSAHRSETAQPMAWSRMGLLHP